MNEPAVSHCDPVREEAARRTTSTDEQRTRRMLDACRARRGKATVIVVAERSGALDGRRHYAIADVW